MKFRALVHYLLAILGCILSFCTYSPDKDFFKELDKLDPAKFTISLNSFDDKDTIYLEAPAEFNYSIKHGSGYLKEVRIIFNNVIIKSTNQASGSFSLPLLSTGTYQLKIEFVSSSGTGSLAEQVGSESVQVWKSWTIKAYIETIPEKPQITLSVVNGYSVINWMPYTKTKFVSYHIAAIMSGLTRNVVITESTITTWTDSIYAGNADITYWVYTKNEVGMSSNAATIKANSNLAINASYNAADSTISVQWSKPVYYGTFKSCSIFEDNIEQIQFTDPDQTTYTFKAVNVGYGYTSTVSARINPKSATQFFAYGWKTLNTSVTPQRFSRNIQRVTYSNGLNSVIGFFGLGDAGKLLIMNPSTYAITDSVDIFNGPGYYIPYNGPFAFYSNPKNLTQLNLITHEEKSIDAITSQFGSGPSVITGSELQIVAYSWFGPGLGNVQIIYYTRLYDMANNTPIAETSQNNTLINYTISDDGQFVRLNNQIYKLNNGGLSLVGTFSYSGTLLGFRKDLCEEILTYSGNHVYVYDANTLALKRTHAAPVHSVFNTYDVATKCLIFNNIENKKIYSINLDTSTMKEFKVNLSSFAFISGTVIINTRDHLRLY